jgi:neutral ceramidase
MRWFSAFFLLLAAGMGSTRAGDLRAGAAAVEINPPKGTPLAGYYSPRGSQTVLDNLYSKAIVLQQGETRIALVVCDLISLPRVTVTEARRLIEKQTGIPGANIMISATHTHTGPTLRRGSALDKLTGGGDDLARRYTETLPERIAQSVVEANRKLAPARLSAAVGQEDGISFNRRYFMRDGTVSWNPRKQHPDVVRPAGPIDPEVGVLYFDTPDGKPLATYVNFALHPDTTGGEGVSADYPGVLSRLLSESKGDAMVTVFANGCCGNINHLDNHWLNPQKGVQEARRIGTALAGVVCKTYPRLRTVNGAELRVMSEMVKLRLAPITEDDLARAKQTMQKKGDAKVPFLETVKAYQVLDVAARDGEPWAVEVQVMSLGDDVAWVSLPGEIFVELGLAIKKASPFRYTMIAELANGSIGYIPNRAAYPQGNYEVVSARCAQGSGEMLVTTALALLRELKQASKAEPRP